MAPHDRLVSRMTAVVSDTQLQREESEALRATSHEQREETAALHAQSHRVCSRSLALRTESNAILDSAEAITSQELAHHRIELAEPVTARFQTDDAGNTGIELRVRLQDPTRIAAARAAIAERFGGIARCDAVIVT